MGRKRKRVSSRAVAALTARLTEAEKTEKQRLKNEAAKLKADAKQALLEQAARDKARNQAMRQEARQAQRSGPALHIQVEAPRPVVTVTQAPEPDPEPAPESVRTLATLTTTRVDGTGRIVHTPVLGRDGQPMPATPQSEDGEYFVVIRPDGEAVRVRGPFPNIRGNHDGLNRYLTAEAYKRECEAAKQVADVDGLAPWVERRPDGNLRQRRQPTKAELAARHTQHSGPGFEDRNSQEWFSRACEAARIRRYG